MGQIGQQELSVLSGEMKGSGQMGNEELSVSNGEMKGSGTDGIRGNECCEW